MTTTDRLRAALHAHAATATPAPDALARIRGRVRRPDPVPRLRLAGALAATAAVVAATVVTTTAVDDDPVSRLTPSPTTAPTQQPTPAPTTPGPDRGVIPTGEFVAFLRDGRLVSASAATGRITRVLAAFGSARTLDGDPAIAPDRRSVYVATRGRATDGCSAVIERYDVATGRAERIAEGRSPEISPDGTKLAYLRDYCKAWDTGVYVLDLATGRRTQHPHVEEGGEAPVPWNLWRHTWHADGRRVWVVFEWERTTDLRLLDPAADRTLRDAQRVKTHYGTFLVERQGADLAYQHECCYPEFEEAAIVVRAASTGTERVLRRSTSSITDLQIGPDGRYLFVDGGRLYVWDGRGAPVDLGASTALGRDW